MPSYNIKLAYDVRRELHPYIPPPESQQTDYHAECFMAFLYCAAANPNAIINLKDDEVIYYTSPKQQNNKYSIRLGGSDVMTINIMML